MTVMLSILLAAIVGGVVFMLLDKWQRQPASASSESVRRPEPASAPLFATARSVAPPPMGRTVESTRPLYTPEERTESLPPRHLWDDPRRDDSDEEDRPPGLWSGWAR